MTLEQEISDLKNAFREYVEVQKKNELGRFIEKDPFLNPYFVECLIDEKYKSVMQYLV